MSDQHYVIIGNGVSANKAADVFRQGDPSSRVTLISDEFFPFYYRHLLRDYLVGKIEEQDLIVRPTSYYKENRIRIRLGQKVVKADLNTRTLFLEHMEKVHYSHLLLCVGGKSRIPEIHYAYRNLFTVLKNLDDARILKKLLPEAKTLVIVGGDMISVRLAHALSNLGKQIHFIIDKDAFWPLELTPKKQEAFSRSLTDKGIEVLGDQSLVDVKRHASGKYSVKTDTGTELDCDLVGAFFGLIPDVEFLIGSGLDIDRGILVDENLRTHFPEVYAAGDCAQIYNSELKNYWVSIGWPNAEKLGELAAKNILGSTSKADIPAHDVHTFEGIKVRSSWWKDFKDDS